VGGYICDTWSWPVIFYINIPIAIVCGFVMQNMLKQFETPIQKNKIDIIGLILLLVWVSALQLMLDEGKNYDWFSSSYITALCIISVIGFACFLIWELTEKNPIVNLNVFKHRGYTISVITISVTFASFFGSIILTPLWLQSILGYTATWAGLTAAMIGVFAVLVAPVVAKLSETVDLRYLSFFGIIWIGALILFRSFSAPDMSYTQIAIPILIQGFGMPFFFLPATSLALSSVLPQEIASAAGLMNFLRTLSGAFAISIVTTAWEDKARIYRSELVAHLKSGEADIAPIVLDRLVDIQSFTLSLNSIFFIISLFIFLAAFIIWAAPRSQQQPGNMTGVH